MAQYDLAFQISPIILQGGVVATTQGGILPITNLMTTFVDDQGQPTPRFQPLPGGTLISQAIGMYPFANQQVAANATIQQPLTISLVMTAPVSAQGGYLSKLPAFTSLQQTLQNHNASGGTYLVATPAFLYSNLVMTAMTDVTSEESRQRQIEWQFDFIAPIVSQAQAQAAQNSLMQTLSNGNQITGQPGWSGTPGVTAANLPGIFAALAAFGATL